MNYTDRQGTDKKHRETGKKEEKTKQKWGLEHKHYNS